MLSEGPTSVEDDQGAVLAEAERLAAAGRTFDAIEIVRSANRRRPDIDLERRLVSLRNRAFRDVDRTQGHASWPPPAPDLFPGVLGPPEVGRNALDARTVASGIGHHGCLLVRGLASPSQVTALTDAVESSFQAIDARAGKAAGADLTPWFIPFRPDSGEKVGLFRRKYVRDGGGVLAADSPRAMFQLIEFFDEVGLSSVIHDYLGERPVVAFDKWTLRRTPVDAIAGWHQDGNFLGAGIRTVNVWLALTDCGGNSDAPGLDIVPRRLEAVLDSGFATAVGQDIAERAAGDTPPVRPSFAAGDALLFDELFLHQTGVSPGMTRERYAIESWFFAPSTFPDNQIPLVY